MCPCTVETVLECLALLTLCLHEYANTAPVQHTQLMVGASFTLNCTLSAANPPVDTVLQVDIPSMLWSHVGYYQIRHIIIHIRMGDAFVQMRIHREHIEIALLILTYLLILN